MATSAAPASIASSFAPSATGESVMPAPTNSAANTGAVSGVTAVQTTSVASESAASSPIRAASVGAEITGGAAACRIIAT